MPVPQPGMKKRQVIASSNKTMFIWVAGMSAVVGVAIVLSVFLIQQIAFKTEVANELDNTASQLDKNINTAGNLIQNVQILETNSALNSVKADENEKALQVVLDALPADNNTLALGASLQQKLLDDISGLSIDSLTVEPANPEGSDASIMPFTLTVSANSANSLKEMLRRLERSIRVIDIDSLTLDRNQSKYTMTIQAHAYYEPATTVELTDKVIKP